MTLLSDFYSEKAANNQSVTELLRVTILHSHISLRECHLELQVVCQPREKNITANERLEGKNKHLQRQPSHTRDQAKSRARAKDNTCKTKLALQMIR